MIHIITLSVSRTLEQGSVAQNPWSTFAEQPGSFLGCLWRIDTVAVKRSDPRTALRLGTHTPNDFFESLCRGWPDTAASESL
jgi:hypothetical protein